MFRSIVIAATVASFATTVGPVPASAQTVYQGGFSGCNPATGLGPNGNPCKGLVRLSNDRINAGERIANVPTLNRASLAEVFDCRDLDSNGVGRGQVELLVEDCGTPAPPATLTNFQPYAGELAAVAPPPPPPAVLPPPPPPPPPVIAAAPPVYAPVQAAGLAGLGYTPLLLGAAGLAAVVGIAYAIDDDDDNSGNSTTTSSNTN